MLQYIDINKLVPHRDNPRKDLGDLTELAESIKAKGILQNLTVVPWNYVEEDKSKWEDDYDHFVVVIGHRRLAAAKLAGLIELPCVVSEMDKREQVATMLLENMQRSDLTIIEQAQGMQMMLDLGETVNTISTKTGFSEKTVRGRVKMLELDQKKLQAAVARGGRMEDYIAINKLEDPKLRNKVLDSVGTNNFDWTLKQAISEEERPVRKKELVEWLDGWAKSCKSCPSGFTQERYFHDFGRGDYKKPKDAETAEYLYVAEQHSITLYKKAEKQAPKKLTKAEKEFQKREARLKEVTAQAYNHRYAFVKDFKAGPKHAESIAAFAENALMCYGRADNDKILDFFGIEKPKLINSDYNGLSEQKRALISAEFAKNPWRVLLITAYLALDDYKTRGYFYSRSWEKKIEHQKLPQLDIVYDLLASIGYEISDEEQALRDGTHELFPVAAEEPESADEPEIPEDEEDGNGNEEHID